jgi:hypothetical protein
VRVVRRGPPETLEAHLPLLAERPARPISAAVGADR